jgi:hypothetical protein
VGSFDTNAKNKLGRNLHFVLFIQLQFGAVLQQMTADRYTKGQTRRLVTLKASREPKKKKKKRKKYSHPIPFEAALSTASKRWSAHRNAPLQSKTWKKRTAP